MTAVPVHPTQRKSTSGRAAPLAGPGAEAAEGRGRAVLIGTAETVGLARGQLALLPDGPVPVGCVLVDRPGEGRAVGGALEVLGGLDDLPVIAAERGVTVAVVSLPAAMAEAINAVRSAVRRAGLPERFLPTLQDLLTNAPPFPVGLGGGIGGVGGGGPGPRVDIAELIGRTPHELDRESVRRLLTGKRVLITGAGGSIGSELARLAASFQPEEIQLMERSENALFEIDRQIARRHAGVARRSVLHDVVDAEGTLRRLVELRPQVVFHAAAHKHVPLMEDHPAHAVSNNLFGTKSIADAALAVGAERFVMISSDKAVNPTSVMGATKRLAELYVQWLHGQGQRSGSATRFGMVRFGNVLGSACSVLTIWSAQLAEGGPVTVTDPRMTRYFMTIPEAATLVIQAAAMTPDDAEGGAAVYVLDMGRPVRIVELAERFVRAHGFEPVIGAGRAPSGLRPPMEVVFSGIRPGEKLDEELAYAAEELVETSHAGIRAWAGAAAPVNCAAMIADLSAVRSSGDRESVLAAIRRHVPEMGAAPGGRAAGRVL